MSWWHYAIIIIAILGFFMSLTAMIIVQGTTANQCVSQKGDWNGNQCTFRK